MKNVIIVGASGMIGGLVLKHCLDSDAIHKVTSVVRKPVGIQHPKLQEVLHQDFLNFAAIENSFKLQDIAYYCLGAYTGAVDDRRFKEITVDATIAFADLLAKQNSDITFCFLSGSGADLSEKSNMSFAKYKGMAENYLLNKNFSHFYSFRPAYIYPSQKRKEPNMLYRIMRFLYPVIRLTGKNFSIKSTDLGAAIFRTAIMGADKMILENDDICFIAQKTKIII